MKKQILSLIVISLISLGAFAQNDSGNPISSKGIGMFHNNIGAYPSMGGISASLKDNLHINFLNPASYTSLDSTRFHFQMGVGLGYSELSEADNNWAHKYGNIKSISIALRIYKNLYTSMGITRPTSSSFHIYDVKDIKKSDYKYLYDFEGGGGMNNAYLGLAYKIKNLSIGVNASILFGKFDKTKSFTTNVSSAAIVNSNERITANGYNIVSGIMYTLKPTKKSSITFGGTFGIGSNMYSERILSTNKTLNNSSAKLQDNVLLNGDITYPKEFSFGVSYKMDDKWTFASEYSQRNMSEYKEFDKTMGFNDDRTYRIGASVTPNSYGRRWIDRNKYMFGAYYNQSYIRMDGNAINTTALTLGAELPFHTRSSQLLLHIGFEAGFSGTNQNNIIKDKFIRINLGITFKELWFMKNKIQ